MANWTKCFECGTDISSDAIFCPKCNIDQRIYYCIICTKELYGKNTHSILCQGQEYRPLIGSHEECEKRVIEEYNSFQFNCKLCGYSWHPIQSNEYCKKCGHPADIGNIFGYSCYNCHRAIIPSVAIKIFDGKHFLHHYCYNQRPDDFKRILFKEKEFNNDKTATSGKQEKICFLATALYGEDSSKVRMLCFFRDEYLSASSLGRAFIALYVRFSPPLARAIAKESLLRTLVRYCIVTPALLFTEKFLAYAGRKERLKQ